MVGRITPRERTCADFVGRSAIFFVGVFLCLLVNSQLLAITIAQPPTSAGASRRRRHERSSLLLRPARPTLASCVTRQAERLGENKFFLGNSFGDSRSTLRSSDGTGACAAGPSLNRCLSAPNTSHQSRRPRFSALRKTTRVSGVMKKIRHRKVPRSLGLYNHWLKSHRSDARSARIHTDRTRDRREFTVPIGATSRRSAVAIGAIGAVGAVGAPPLSGGADQSVLGGFGGL